MSEEDLINSRFSSASLVDCFSETIREQMRRAIHLRIVLRIVEAMIRAEIDHFDMTFAERFSRLLSGPVREREEGDVYTLCDVIRVETFQHEIAVRESRKNLAKRLSCGRVATDHDQLDHRMPLDEPE